MINSFQSHTGDTYSLLGCAVDGSDIGAIQKLDHEYFDQAFAMSQQKKSHIFYNLKKYTDRGYEYSQYFLVPVDSVDVEKIPLMFNVNKSDYYFGICYYHEVPDISYDEKMDIRRSFWDSDNMTGYDYEKKCSEELRKMGFSNIEVTRASADQGIDVIAWKDGLKYGIQCKHYSGSVPNKAVQEASAGAKFYDCDVAVVMTNSIFTKSAEELAHKIGVKLWSNNITYREV